MLSSRFLRFLLVGTLNTALNYGIYALFIFIGLGYFIAASLAFAAGLLIGYRAHARFVFEARGNHRAFLLYAGSWMAIYVVHVSVLGVLVRAGVDSYLAGAILLPFVVVLSYLVMRFVVFPASRGAGK